MNADLIVLGRRRGREVVLARGTTTFRLTENWTLEPKQPPHLRAQEGGTIERAYVDTPIGQRWPLEFDAPEKVRAGDTLTLEHLRITVSPEA